MRENMNTNSPEKEMRYTHHKECTSRIGGGKSGLDPMIGKRFGRWVVIERSKYASPLKHYLCFCDCNAEGVVSGAKLRQGKSTQCKPCKDKNHNGWLDRKKRSISPPRTSPIVSSDSMGNVKCSYYLNKASEIKIAKICINRMEHGDRSSKSSVIDDAIGLLYKKVFEDKGV